MVEVLEMWLRNKRRIRSGHASSFGVQEEYLWGKERDTDGGGGCLPLAGAAGWRGRLWDGAPRPGRGGGPEGLSSPGRVEGGREQQLIVQGDGQVARLAEGGGDGPGGAAEEAAPAQEQCLGCGTRGRESGATRPLSVPAVLGVASLGRGPAARQEDREVGRAPGGAEWRARARRAQQKQLTHNHDVVPAVVMAEVEVTARGSVASGHQGRVDASFQGPHRPHHQEAQHEQQEQPQPLQQPPIAQVGAPLGRAR